MGLRLYNTLTRTKQDFVPIDPQNVRMYVCGPTVYDFAHIGNARPLIVFDVLFRLLRHLYGPEYVTYVRNITDIEDKIIARAARDLPDLPLNEAVKHVTATTEKQFHEDVRALGCLEPTVEPRATEHIAEMKAMIETLVEKCFAYVAEDHVLFHVAAMKDYGKLSNRSLDEMIAGARVEVAPYKRDPMDFVLWKPSKPSEPAWSSPAGIATPGRPGWHLECSAMSDKWLWEAALGNLSEAGLAHPHQFDIHGGGIDLVFPHHENEIAQSRSAHGTPAMANYWLHNGYLQVEGEKMAKSAGNFVTISQLLHTVAFGDRQWSGAALRLAMLRTHYRQPLDWTVDNLGRAAETLDRWRAFAGERTTKSYNRDAFARFVGLIEDDLNTPGALSIIDEIVANEPQNPDDRYFVYKALNLLGFKVPLSPTKRAANSVIRLIKTLESLPDSFVQTVATKALVSPRYRNGKFRPEANLVLGLAQLERLTSSRGMMPTLNEKDVAEFSQTAGVRDSKKISELIEVRATARKAKNWAEADRIRDELDAMGIALKDAKDPKTGELVTTWEVKR